MLDDKLHWYKDAIIYELHIKAFRDGNCDGIGDFKGLMERLDYLQNLGVTAIWLLPFYPSPLKDDGYDIADYYSINPSYGDIEEFKAFLKEAHKRNLKVITELVINHTSDQHPWFQRARRSPKGSPYRDYYVWTDDPNQFHEVRIIFQDFEGSNWTWDPVAQQYYWHRFFHHQPDLNYDNPLVQEEVFRVLDFWCKLGVDGFRLDAVPYLFEREGTNCENLPETHAFLKKLRKHVDENFPGTLLLAEANMWPEDSAAYFGDGDECHMNYHFPVMPRMFMALQMEDRYPITDIFDQTPDIPETCQWAMFLRNHDELTLEMVTDEERDYMYKAYVKDPKARINLGIRHRLAPLMENSRAKIELLNYLLFSLPGTPVIYYGDEIGMGDNFYLGDRDGVRTPMQWSADRNAGFSEANPHKLYLPVILDPAYHYESVNVDIQRGNTNSLLWWTKRMINIRKQYKAFSRGDLKFIPTENSKILAFTRTYQEETILVIVNLSRYSQPAEIDLKDFKGYVPVEILSKNKFPSILEDKPYFFTLGPFDCHWFQLEKVHLEVTERRDLPIIELSSWEAISNDHHLRVLETEIFPEYLLKVRWFGGKARGIESVRIVNKAELPSAHYPSLILIVEVNYQNGLPETYQVPVSFAPDKLATKLSSTAPQSIICQIKIDGHLGALFDSAFSEDFQQALFKYMSDQSTVKLTGGELRFTGSELLNTYVAEHDKVKSKVLSAEQSNSSITFDNKFFLKLYRKVDTAINPDLEINKFLAESNFENIPQLAGSVEWKIGNSNMVLGMMQEMVENSGDAWSSTIDRLTAFYEEILSGTTVEAPTADLKGSLTAPAAFEEVPEQIKKLLDATIAERVELLGRRTGEMHRLLASNNEDPAFKPEEYSLHYQRSLFSSLQSLVRATFDNQRRNLNKLQGEAKDEALEVLGMREEILSTFKRIYSRKIDVVKIRLHGDYHLGQVLFTGKDYVILDFEGEPAKAYSERRLKRSALRDVAGMIRSFHYAAYAGLFLDDKISEADAERLIPYAEQWYHYMAGFFMKGYLETVKDTMIIPKDKESLEILIQTFLLEKAVYELNYELNNRPSWVIIPIRGIKAILGEQTLAKT
ncbi:maltose alpha-D-glucosyltransferase [Desertivirga arenae]|uniref:maltose alpha-D-glucosyltransferase n=1 Tax=Desertivirga arenae TaxID=2810309 RepID=UPI001A971DB6|nr:maltose alpha-D-glucosyltransferase [Pedobacter sp. SYSU D00823]